MPDTPVRSAPRNPRSLAAALAAGAALLAAATPAQAQSGSSCATWPAGDKSTPSLQRTVKANVCVTVRPGAWAIAPGGVLLPSGHTLQGQSASSTVLTASRGAWNGGSGMVRIAPSNAKRATLRGLGIHADDRALLGVSGGQVLLDAVTISGARCNGLSAFGRGITVTRSTFSGNGYGGTCPDAPPGAAIYAHLVKGNPIGPMRITTSTFEGNGPALDVDQGVNGGTFAQNTVSGGGGWAGVSIFKSSGWTIDRNVVRNPSRATGGTGRGFDFSYNAPCNGGPAGAHPAAIILCQSSAANGRLTQRNRVTGNQVSSYYGILLIGGDEAAADNVPRANEVTGNRVAGSRYGCADDSRPGQAGGPNTWSGNDCAAPGYF